MTVYLIEYMKQINIIIKRSEIQIPKVFWKYYDLYRRNKIQLKELSDITNLSEEEISLYLKYI